MPRAFISIGANVRRFGNLPPLALVNMFAEATPTDQGGVALQSRPGLSQSYEVGSGPVTGIFQQPGLFNGDILTVSDGNLYRGTTLVGAIVGSGPVSFASSLAEVVITAGSTLYSYDGTTLSAVAFPDGASVTAVAYLSGYFIAARADTGRFYWSAVNDGTTWDALDFANAESSADALRDIKVVNEELWLIGQDTIEPWRPNASVDPPFFRLEGRIITKGVMATGCARALDNTLFWPGDAGVVFRASGVPQRVSNHAIEERLKVATDVLGFAFYWEGHGFYGLRIDDECHLFDVASGEWTTFSTLGLDSYNVLCAENVATVPYFGGHDDGTIWVWDGFADGASQLERRFTVGVPIDGGTFAIDDISLTVNCG
ncbi:MAG: packaged DNA stabilization protein, partial [Burkholderiales bacterium]